MEHSATPVILKVLDGLSLRAEATAHNIANAATAGYRPLRVSFEQALREAAAGGAALDQVQPRVETSAATEAEMRLDLELATASSTSARYAALTEILNRQLQLEALAVSQGR